MPVYMINEWREAVIGDVFDGHGENSIGIL